MCVCVCVCVHVCACDRAATKGSMYSKLGQGIRVSNSKYLFLGGPNLASPSLSRNQLHYYLVSNHNFIKLNFQ